MAEELFHRLLLNLNLPGFAWVPRNSECLTYFIPMEVFFFHLTFFLVISLFSLSVKCEDEIMGVKHSALGRTSVFIGSHFFPYVGR